MPNRSSNYSTLWISKKKNALLFERRTRFSQTCKKIVLPLSFNKYKMTDLSKIYSAVYSGVPVFEMVVNDVAVMRRRTDSYMNATQILKVANIEKGKRTKILEKEVLIGEHEKVQGGYGKYQGTW